MTVDQFTTAFKPKTKELVERSSAIKSQFLEMSKRKERPSSHKKEVQPLRLIIKDNQEMLVKAIKIDQKSIDYSQDFVSPCKSEFTPIHNEITEFRADNTNGKLPLERITRPPKIMIEK